MGEINLFTELCNTLLDEEERVKMTLSAAVHSDALYHLRQMADDDTLARCLDKLQEERRK